MSFDFDIARQIEARAAPARDSNPFWISTPDGEYETNNGSDWCHTCAGYIFRHLKRRDRRRAESYFLDGGWRTESDGHKFCAHCGAWLRISLTDYAIEEELAHYRENGITRADENEAYSLSLLINAVSWNDDRADEVMGFARLYLSLPPPSNQQAKP